ERRPPRPDDLQRDHPPAHVHHRDLRDERRLPRLRRPRGVLGDRRGDGRDPRRDGRVLPLQALALIPILAAVLALAGPVPRPTADRFDEHAAWALLVHQVRLGPRPAGSPTSRKLAAELKAALPRGSYQLVPGGLRNVVGFVRGRNPRRYVVVA